MPSYSDGKCRCEITLEMQSYPRDDQILDTALYKIEMSSFYPVIYAQFQPAYFLLYLSLYSPTYSKKPSGNLNHIHGSELYSLLRNSFMKKEVDFSWCHVIQHAKCHRSHQ